MIQNEYTPWVFVVEDEGVNAGFVRDEFTADRFFVWVALEHRNERFEYLIVFEHCAFAVDQRQVNILHNTYTALTLKLYITDNCFIVLGHLGVSRESPPEGAAHARNADRNCVRATRTHPQLGLVFHFDRPWVEVWWRQKADCVRAAGDMRRKGERLISWYWKWAVQHVLWVVGEEVFCLFNLLPIFRFWSTFLTTNCTQYNHVHWRKPKNLYGSYK